MDKSIYTFEYECLTQLLRQLREESGMTQIEFAESLGQSQSFVSKVERGERRLDIVQLRTIGGVLGVKLPEIVQRLEALIKRRSRRR